MTLDTIATITSIMASTSITVSIVAAFIPKVRKRMARHFVDLVREASNDE